MIGGRARAGVEATPLLSREVRATLLAPEMFVPNLLIPVAGFFIMTASLLAMADWPRIVATLNPVTYVLDGMRVLTVTGWEPGQVAGRSHPAIGRRKTRCRRARTVRPI